MLLLLLAACVRHIGEPVVGPDRIPPGASGRLRVCWVEFATGFLPPGMAVAHGSVHTPVPATQSGLLLIHPAGIWLVDGGASSDPKGELSEVHGLARFFLGRAAAIWTVAHSSAAAVQAAGVDPRDLTGLLPTHGHFDHLGGLLELEGIPVSMPAVEAEPRPRGNWPRILPRDARVLAGRLRPLVFAGPPFHFWPSSHDLFGDGSVTVIPTPGHTAGSVSVWVRPAGGSEILLVGDTVWAREGFEQLEPKGPIAAGFDEDRAGTDAEIARLHLLHRSHPEVAILPAHDRRSWLDTFGQPGCPD